jgi:uncharacterized protein (DUF1810 family)
VTDPDLVRFVEAQASVYARVVEELTEAHPDWTIWTPVAAAGAIAIWGIGRAARYLLSGH